MRLDLEFPKFWLRRWAATLTNWVWRRFGDEMNGWSPHNPTLGVPLRNWTWISGFYWLDRMAANLDQFGFGRGAG